MCQYRMDYGSIGPRGPPLDIWEGGPLFFFYFGSFYLGPISQGMLKALFFSPQPQDRLEIFISIFILHSFQPPLWIKYLFPPCLAANYLFKKKKPPDTYPTPVFLITNAVMVAPYISINFGLGSNDYDYEC